MISDFEDFQYILSSFVVFDKKIIFSQTYL